MSQPMYHHVKKLMYIVRVDAPDPAFGNMLLEQRSSRRKSMKIIDSSGWTRPRSRNAKRCAA